MLPKDEQALMLWYSDATIAGGIRDFFGLTKQKKRVFGASWGFPSNAERKGLEGGVLWGHNYTSFEMWEAGLAAGTNKVGRAWNCLYGERQTDRYRRWG